MIPRLVSKRVSLTINSDLYAQVKQLDINASQVAEEALA
jgi:post-segregation antitoxin (ccd killing protein)